MRNYLSRKKLKYATYEMPMINNDLGVLPQESVFEPLLWNIMYNGVLRLNFPHDIHVFNLAYNKAIVIVAIKFTSDRIENQGGHST